MAFRLILHPASSPARNMAIDESLLRHIQSPVLRIYSWDQPCISIGYFQKAQLAPADRPMIRRYTGGGMVKHGSDLTYTLVFPASHPLTTAGTLASYKAVHQAIAQAIQDSGTPCHLATGQPKEDDPACFLKPVPADVLDSAGHKLAGAAQRRTKRGCLHQGSILFPKPIPFRLIELLPIALTSCLQEAPAPSTLTQDEIQQADQLEKDRYSTREWNYSR